MSEQVRGPAPNPCGSCPYRRDVPSRVWAVEEYDKLPRYDADTASQPAGLFLCHQTSSDDPSARLCAGWVGCHGNQLLALRLAWVARRISGDVFDYTTTVPLFANGSEARAHGIRDITRPDVLARKAIEKITARRPDMETADV